MSRQEKAEKPSDNAHERDICTICIGGGCTFPGQQRQPDVRCVRPSQEVILQPMACVVVASDEATKPSCKMAGFLACKELQTKVC